MNSKGRPGRAKSGRFLLLPHVVINSDAFADLRGNSVKLLVLVASQYSGKNNGDLTAAFTVMQSKGFNSKDTLNRALKQLLDHGFIIKTRQGRFMNPGHRCDLYAITWKAIDECPDKDLEVGPSRKPLMLFKDWKKQNAQSENRTKLAPKTGTTNGKAKDPRPENRYENGKKEPFTEYGNRTPSIYIPGCSPDLSAVETGGNS